MKRLYRTRWFMPAFSLFLGALIFGAYWIGDKPGLGVEAVVVMAVLAAILWFGSRRSETLAGLGGPGRDERWERIDVHATALTGLTQLGAIGGLGYLLAVAFLRWRS